MNSTHNNSGCGVFFSEEEALQYLYSYAKKIFILVVVPVIVGLGVLGNVALLFVVYRVQGMRTVTNFYLSNLAVSDSMLLIMAAWTYLWTYFRTPIDYWGSSYSGFGCALESQVIYTCYFSSVFLIMLVTFERYMAICHPFTHRMLKGKNWTAGMTMIAWLLAFISACFSLDIHKTDTICIDWSENGKYQDAVGNFLTCNAPWNSDCSWCWLTLVFIELVQFVLAVVLSSYMYTRIIYVLSTRSGVGEEQMQSSKEQATAMLHARNQIARMLILNGTVFFMCLAPFELVNVSNVYQLLFGEPIFDTKTMTFIVWVGRVAMLVNSAVNPLLYNVSNGRYRKAFAEAFMCARSRKGSSTEMTGTGVIAMSQGIHKTDGHLP